MTSGIHPSPGYTASLTFQAVSQQREESTATAAKPRSGVRIRANRIRSAPPPPGNTAQLRADSSGGRNVPDTCEYAC